MSEPTEPNDLELLTVLDICRLFKVTRDWVYDEVEAGRLPALRLGRKHLRFRRYDLEEYLAGRSPANRRREQPGTKP